MLAMTLSPTIAHALAAQRGQAPWSEICTTQTAGTAAQAVRGASKDPLAGEQAPVPVSIAAHLDHCPYCGLAASTPVLPPSTAVAPLLIVAHAGPAPLFLHAPRTPFAWRTAQPRAPPSRS